MPKANSKKAARALPSAGTSSAAASTEPLFEIDTAGSSSVRHALLAEASGQSAAGGKARKGSSFSRPLKSDQILAMRSDAPAMTSRRVPTASAALAKREERRREKVDRETKERLKRIVGRDGQGEGLWGVKSGEMVVRETAGGGGYDAWEIVERKKATDLEKLKEENALRRKAVPKAPETLAKHKLLSSTITPRAIPIPHPGTSYNPAHPHHQSLLANALVSYEAAELSDARGEEEKAAMEALRLANKGKETWEMYEDEVGSGESGDEADEGDDAEVARKKLSKRKTRTQRNKAAAHEAQVEAQRAEKAFKQRLNSLSNAKSLNKSLRQSQELSLAEKAVALKLQRTRLAATGLSKMRSGPSRVPEAPIQFQLGEELADNLRTLQPEGNLWREWVGSGMRRGRVPVERSNAQKNRGGKYGRGKDKGSRTKEKEVYAYKNFKV